MAHSVPKVRPYWSVQLPRAAVFRLPLHDGVANMAVPLLPRIAAGQEHRQRGVVERVEIARRADAPFGLAPRYRTAFFASRESRLSRINS